MIHQEWELTNSPVAKQLNLAFCDKIMKCGTNVEVTWKKDLSYRVTAGDP